ncbi:unnamed protein product [Gongylonema pulchrum]|uniref:Ovule protein n=1 Tax=Gongylonema pulchrum TaxID=637853 RepID=A0A183DNP5_9BILA|nr:unnamed protein product [Gongylonema pulchrum]
MEHRNTTKLRCRDIYKNAEKMLTLFHAHKHLRLEGVYSSAYHNPGSRSSADKRRMSGNKPWAGDRSLESRLKKFQKNPRSSSLLLFERDRSSAAELDLQQGIEFCSQRKGFIR